MFFFTKLGSGWAQDLEYSIHVPPGVREGAKPPSDSIDFQRYYTYCEVRERGQPVDGWHAFYQDLENLNYPSEAKSRKLQCAMTVTYRLDENGHVDSVYVPHYETYGRWEKCAPCEQLMIDYVNNTTWTAGRLGETAVKTTDYFYVEFRIHDPNAKEPASVFGW